MWQFQSSIRSKCKVHCHQPEESVCAPPDSADRRSAWQTSGLIARLEEVGREIHHQRPTTDPSMHPSTLPVSFQEKNKNKTWLTFDWLEIVSPIHINLLSYCPRKPLFYTIHDLCAHIFNGQKIIARMLNNCSYRMILVHDSRPTMCVLLLRG